VKSPSILIVNDDGIFSEGIKALWEAMSEIGETTVVAPKSEHSGAGHAITISRPLQSENISLSCGLSGYAVNGTPAYSVKFAMSVVMKTKPDILVSGINPGSNVGQSILYSGTVSAAREGTFRGINSIALSIDGDSQFNYQGAKEVSKTLVNSVINNNLPNHILLNVNIPNIPLSSIKGYKITKQGSMSFNDKFEKFNNSRGSSYYWLTAEQEDPDKTNKSDRIAVKNGFVSITPIHSVQTDFEFMDELNNWKIDQ